MTEAITANLSDQAAIPVTPRLQEELDFWINLPESERISPWFTSLPQLPSSLVFTDSSMAAMGFYILNEKSETLVNDTEYFDENWQEKPIALKEAQAILRLLQRYPMHLTRRNIISMCDNMNVYQAFKSDGNHI